MRIILEEQSMETYSMRRNPAHTNFTLVHALFLTEGVTKVIFNLKNPRA